MRGQSVSDGVRARAWQAAISAWRSRGRARRVDWSAFDCGQAAMDQELIPMGAVLIEQ